MFVEFESQPQVEAGDEVEIIEKAVLYGVLFNKERFAGHIAENTLAAFDEGIVSIADISTLTISASDKEQARPWEDGEFEFSVSGQCAHYMDI